MWRKIFFRGLKKIIFGIELKSYKAVHNSGLAGSLLPGQRTYAVSNNLLKKISSRCLGFILAATVGWVHFIHSSYMRKNLDIAWKVS